MTDTLARQDFQEWERQPLHQVLDVIVQDLYHPVSILGSHLHHLTHEDDPLSEEEYEEIFRQMQDAVNHLSRTIVSLKRYVQDQQERAQQTKLPPQS